MCFCAIPGIELRNLSKTNEGQLKQQLVPETYFYLLLLLEVSMNTYTRYNTIRKRQVNKNTERHKFNSKSGLVYTVNTD